MGRHRRADRCTRGIPRGAGAPPSNPSGKLQMRRPSRRPPPLPGALPSCRTCAFHLPAARPSSPRSSSALSRFPPRRNGLNCRSWRWRGGCAIPCAHTARVACPNRASSGSTATGGTSSSTARGGSPTASAAAEGCATAPPAAACGSPSARRPHPPACLSAHCPASSRRKSTRSGGATSTGGRGKSGEPGENSSQLPACSSKKRAFAVTRTPSG